jgi:hypothetical protein
MSTYQTLYTLVAFIMLSIFLGSFYNILARNTDGVSSAQAGISELTLATTYEEYANQLSFDEFTIDSMVTNAQASLLTTPAHLGPDNPPPTGEPTENSLKTFDDLDDLKGYSLIDTSFVGSAGTFKVLFDVNYVSPTNIDQVSNTQTFVKRLDVRVVRTNPVSKDTLQSSIIMGYFHFD